MEEILKNNHIHALIAFLASVILYKVIELIVYKSSKTFLSKIDVGKRETITSLIDKIIKKVNKDISELKEPMEFLGYNEFSDSGLKIRFAFKTDVLDKFSTDRKIKKIIKEVMDKEKIYIPYNKISIIKE